MVHEWKNWCRICGQNNVFIETDDEYPTLVETVEKFLSIEIKLSDISPTKICEQCCDFLMEISEFSERSLKVQKMFTDLQRMNETVCAALDLENFKKQYMLLGISNIIDKEQIFEENTNETSESEDDNDFSINIKEETSDYDMEDDGELSEKKNSDPIEISVEKNDGSRQRLQRNCKSVIEIEGKKKKPLKKIPNKNNIALNESISETESYYSTSTKNKKKNLPKRPLGRPRTKIRKPLEPDAIQCDLCERKFNKEASVRVHKKYSHNIIAEKTIYPCTLCKIKFVQKKTLEIHLASHSLPKSNILYPCTECKKKFAKKSGLRSHYKFVHLNENGTPYVCDECGMVYKTTAGLRCHKRLHKEPLPLPFACNVCGKRTQTASILKRHMELHSGATYTCEICNAIRSTKKGLKLHMYEIHSGEKKYKCNFCGKQFSRSGSFKKHLIVHTGLRPFQCQWCDLAFADGSNRRNHQKRRHPKELADMQEAGEVTPHVILPKIQSLQPEKYIGEL